MAKPFIIMQEDIYDTWTGFPMRDTSPEPEQWLEAFFKPLAHPHISAIVWDMGLETDAYQVYQRGSLPLRDFFPTIGWGARGFDVLERLTEKSRAQGLLNIWNHRLCEVDGPHPLMDQSDRKPYTDMSHGLNYLKREHQDWVLPSWIPQGSWNLAVPALREHKVKILREVVENYDLDGVQLDFARHTPVLPIDHEWEMREHATAFVELVRQMLDKIPGRHRLLLVRVAETVEGNHLDGFDVETWVKKGFLDIIVPGGRASVIDFKGYRSLDGLRKPLICPSLDGHHTPTAYHAMHLGYMYGILGNWFAQDTDGVSLFNWLAHVRDKSPRTAHIAKNRMAVLAQLAHPGEFTAQATFYPVERCGQNEYPWAQNYLYKCPDKPLPVTLPPGKETVLPLEIYGHRNFTTLTIMAEKMREPDLDCVSINGVTLQRIRFDANYLDMYNTLLGEKKYPGAFYAGARGALRDGINNICLRTQSAISVCGVELNIS